MEMIFGLTAKQVALEREWSRNHPLSLAADGAQYEYIFKKENDGTVTVKVLCHTTKRELDLGKMEAPFQAHFRFGEEDKKWIEKLEELLRVLNGNPFSLKFLPSSIGTSIRIEIDVTAYTSF